MKSALILKNVILTNTFKFSSQGSGKGYRKKTYVNISKIIKNQEEQVLKSNTFAAKNHNNPSNNIEGQSNPIQNAEQQLQNLQKPAYTHISTQQQQFNSKIRTSIHLSSLYYLHGKNRHKLLPRHYALIFCKMIELRKNDQKQRKQQVEYKKFLTQVIFKKIYKMAPQDLIIMIYELKYQNIKLNKNQMLLIFPIIQKIIDEFSNNQGSQLEPKSFQTLKFSTNVKLFHSLEYLLEGTGIECQKKIKQILKQTLNYIIFKAMKNKKQTKNGEYFALHIKLSFLNTCKKIQAGIPIVRNLIRAILVEKDRLTLDDLFQIEKAIFDNQQVLQKCRSQLFSQKPIHVPYNNLYRIQKYIQNKYPNQTIKNPQVYQILNKKMVNHIWLLNSLSVDELLLLDMNAHKDQQISKTLILFHQGYKNYFIENYKSQQQKYLIDKFFRKSQHQTHALYYLFKFFHQKLIKDGVNSLRPSLKKQLKQFINILCKFLSKLSYLTQSIVIQLLILSNYSSVSLKPLLITYFETNTYAPMIMKQQGRKYFLGRDKLMMTDQFLSFLKYKSTFCIQKQAELQFQVFFNSNLKNILKYIMKKAQINNTQKFAYYLAQITNNKITETKKRKKSKKNTSQNQLSNTNSQYYVEDKHNQQNSHNTQQNKQLNINKQFKQQVNLNKEDKQQQNLNDQQKQQIDVNTQQKQWSPIDLQYKQKIFKMLQKVYKKISQQNRCFNRYQIDQIFSKKQKFISQQFIQPQLPDQSDLYGMNLYKKQQQFFKQSTFIISTLEADKDLFRQDYQLEQKIRYKIRRMFQNAKFVLAVINNIRLIHNQKNSSYKQSNKQNLQQRQQINKKLLQQYQQMEIRILKLFKTQLECLKFQKLFTKQNCTDANDIFQSTKHIWHKASSKVQVRNQTLIQKNQQIRIKEQNQKIKLQKAQQQTIELKQQHLQNLQKDSNIDNRANKVQTHNSIQNQELIQDQDDLDFSQQHQYTEQVQFIQGKQLMDLKVMKIFLQKKQKSKTFTYNKNRQAMVQLMQITKNLTQVPAQITKKPQQIKLLQRISSAFLIINQDQSQKSQQLLVMQNLASTDSGLTQNQNLQLVSKFTFSTIDQKTKCQLKVFKKLFYGLYQINKTQNKLFISCRRIKIPKKKQIQKQEKQAL